MQLAEIMEYEQVCTRQEDREEYLRFSFIPGRRKQAVLLNCHLRSNLYVSILASASQLVNLNLRALQHDRSIELKN